MKHAPLLSARAINSITKDGLHAVGGATGLYLRIRGTSKQYVLRYTSPSGTRSMISLGNFKDLTISEARAIAVNMRAMLAEGTDPIQDRKEKKAAKTVPEVYTFKDAASEWHNMRLNTGYFNTRQQREENIRRTLEMHIYPFIGNMPLRDLKASDVFNCVRPVWTTSARTGKLCVSIIGQVWDWAVAMGKTSGENPSRLSSALGVLLRAHGEPKSSRNHGALAPAEIPDFIAALYARKGTVYKALLFAILTASRGRPVRYAKWQEFDLEKKVWIVPEENMKVKQQGNFKVFLSDQAIEVLKSLPRSEKGYVFLGDRNDSLFLSTSFVRAMEYFVKSCVKRGLPKWIDKAQSEKLGREVAVTPHGVARASFKTWTRTGENLKKFHTDAVEMCLAHTIDTRYDGAYDRASLEEERRRVMAAWGEFCFSKIPPKEQGS